VVEDAVVVVNGYVDNRSEDVKVVVRDIQELQIRDDSVVRLGVPASRLTPETVGSLKSILSNHPGTSPVYLHLTDDGNTKVLKLASEHEGQPHAALFARLKERLGPRAILYPAFGFLPQLAGDGAFSRISPPACRGRGLLLDFSPSLPGTGPSLGFLPQLAGGVPAKPGRGSVLQTQASQRVRRLPMA